MNYIGKFKIKEGQERHVRFMLPKIKFIYVLLN